MKRTTSYRFLVFGLGLLGLLALASCVVEGDSDRQVLSDRGFSMMPLDGWTETTTRGDLVFLGPEEMGLQRNTIAIRSARKHGEWSKPRTPDLVVPATAKLLDALPGRRMSRAVPMRGNGLIGAAFDVSFEPRAKDGQRYSRRHVVLVGEKRVFHVLHTAPEGDLEYTAEVFDAVIDSLREEV